MKQSYATPALMDYGPIADSTFAHPRRHRPHLDLPGRYGEDCDQLDQGGLGSPVVVPT